ncbi:VVA0879 family protein [Streptomyces cylindrosporus]|uniref:Uncharacterized protein n=1 Tax=Streptomyces cylindrosporus TaxID=2927583 RepID=A0ABS9YJZ5_9ACTN|nr:VVA0879 family protein [Streptomyces cylindrosporus]MCI3277567.1 hypothetical protein [Streptomyces cylindrosporus]
MTVAFPARTLTQEELWAEARERFGDNSRDWAFQCPSCLDIATGIDIQQALLANPRTNPQDHEREGRPTAWMDVLGQECIGRLLGKTASRGCKYAAFGFIHGPWLVAIPYRRAPMYSFPLAPAPGTQGQATGAAEAAAALPSPPPADERLPRLLKHIQDKGKPVTTADVHRVYRSWGWKGLNRSQTRGELEALAQAGHLIVDDGNPARRLYRPVRTSRGGGTS